MGDYVAGYMSSHLYKYLLDVLTSWFTVGAEHIPIYMPIIYHGSSKIAFS